MGLRDELRSAAYALLAPKSRLITATAPLTIAGGASADLSADRVIAIAAASGAAPGSMAAADFTKLAGIEGAATKVTSASWDIGDADLTVPSQGGSPAWQDLPGATITLAGNGTTAMVEFYVCGSSGSFNNLVRFRMMLDGVVVAPAPVGGLGFYANNGLGILPARTAARLTGLAAGNRVIKIQVIDAYGAGTAQILASTNFAYGQTAHLRAHRF